MGGKRNYRSAVEKALFVVSRGSCYAPTCKNPVVTIDDDGEPCVEVAIAHICAAEKGGPRYDELMTPEERRSFPNLILLCKRHHEKVDGRQTWRDYPRATLKKWKTDRESGLIDKIAGLNKLTEDRLKEMLVDVTSTFRKEMMGALDTLKGMNQEVVEMLKELIDEPFSRPVLDPDMLNSLENSTRALLVLQDYAPMLRESAEVFGGIEDHTGTLARFNDSVETLAGMNLDGLMGALTRTEEETFRFSRAVDSLTGLDLAAVERTLTRLASTAANLSDRYTTSVSTTWPAASRRTVETRPAPRPKVIMNDSWFGRHKVLSGMGMGAGLVVAIQVLALVLVIKLGIT